MLGEGSADSAVGNGRRTRPPLHGWAPSRRRHIFVMIRRVWRRRGVPAPFGPLADRVRRFAESLPLLRDLKHEALRDRHWRRLMEVSGQHFARGVGDPPPDSGGKGGSAWHQPVSPGGKKPMERNRYNVGSMTAPKDDRTQWGLEPLIPSKRGDALDSKTLET